MADQNFVVGYRAAVDKAAFLTAEASEVVEEISHWKITGDKGTLWAEQMLVKKK